MAKSQKSWQSRINAEQDELAVEFVESLSVDTRLYKYDIAGSIAHAQMLSEQRLITQKEFRQIREALTEIADEIEQDRFTFEKTCEDIHMAIEAALIEKIGEVGKKLHTGRSRNDQVALDMRLWMRDCISFIGDDLRALQRTFVKLAGTKQGQVVMPGYTHLQRAQPVLSGSYLLAFVEQFERDRQRFKDCYERVNVSPLGCGALAGSSLPLNRERTAELLGFPAITRNSLDTIADRDFCIEFTFCCAMAAMHLSRWAEDWIIYSSQEFGFIRTDDAYCTGSSMMPQKRNPDMLELVRGKTAGVYGNLIALLTLMKAQPLTYNRDMQEDKKHIFDAADTLRASLKMAAAVVGHTKFGAEQIKRGLDEGFLDATALAEYLVSKGVPFREAHQVVGRTVARCEKENLALRELSLEALQQQCNGIEKDVYDYLTADNVVARYATPGSAGRQQLQDQLDRWNNVLK